MAVNKYLWESEDRLKDVWVRGSDCDLISLLVTNRFTYVSPADGTTGQKEKNGTWSGVTGMLARKV